jgi:hypothetical protein
MGSSVSLATSNATVFVSPSTIKDVAHDVTHGEKESDKKEKKEGDVKEDGVKNDELHLPLLSRPLTRCTYIVQLKKVETLLNWTLFMDKAQSIHVSGFCGENIVHSQVTGIDAKHRAIITIDGNMHSLGCPDISDKLHHSAWHKHARRILTDRNPDNEAVRDFIQAELITLQNS